MFDLILRNASLFDPADELLREDLAIADGRIVERGPELSGSARAELALDGRLLIPGFVESHLHLDITLMNPMDLPGRAEPYLSHYGLNTTMEKRRRDFTRSDIEHRAGRAIEMASRHGVVALRAQCHVDLEVGLNHLEALLAVREKYRDRMTLQIVTFPQQGLLQFPGTLELFREAFRKGADVMGCASNLDRGVSFREHIDAALALAAELNVDFDIHADLGIPWEIDVDDLEVVYLARRAKQLGYTGKITAGHFCAFDSLNPEHGNQVIQLILASGINIISQPDLYRLGRDDRQHVRRGLTRVKELLSNGVTVAYASNNVRDALRPLGNFDLLEEGLVLAYGAHMDTIEELETILKMSTYNAAHILGLSSYGLHVGDHADLVVLDAPSPSAAIVNQAEKLYVIKSGRIAATNSRTTILQDLRSG